MCKVTDGIILLLLGMCSISDWKKKTMPLSLLLLLSVAVAFSAVVCTDVEMRLRVGGGLIGIGFLLISKCTGEAIGYGDSWLILLMGVRLGSLRMLEVLFVASMLAAIVSLVCLWRYRWNRTKTFPFVPLLSISYLGVILL